MSPKIVPLIVLILVVLGFLLMAIGRKQSAGDSHDRSERGWGITTKIGYGLLAIGCVTGLLHFVFHLW
jgi:hypothetical protein